MRNNHFLILYFLAFILLASACRNPEQERFDAYISEGERLAKIYCTTCHMETTPDLLNNITWTFKIMPQMGPRLGMHNYKTIHYPRINPMLVAKLPAMTQEQWENIVDYFHNQSPDSLPAQDFPTKPKLISGTFSAEPFTKEISSSSIISMINVDTTNKHIFTADVQNSVLSKFDYQGNLLDTMQLSSPPTAMRIEDDFFDMTLAGILHPNNESKGEIVRYIYPDSTSQRSKHQLIDSLIRPVASLNYDFNYDGLDDYLVCEYGNDIGRLAIYYANSEQGYDQYILENIPGAIMIKTHDMNQDGFMDIVALFAQGDERITIFYNDGKGEFRGNFSLASRFPAVYGSMYFELSDYNQDGFMDILYVNGDNFDYSPILKPYHGIRILENDGDNYFEEKYFYPIYGAGKSVTLDFDLDGDLDILVSSNFADMDNNPERGIIYLENEGDYDFNAYSFEAAAQNQWNTMGVADVDGDGDQDVLIGAMNLSNVLKVQKTVLTEEVDLNTTSLLLMRNKTK